MDNIRLVRPDETYRESYLEALAEFHAEGRYLDRSLPDLTADFGAFVDGLNGMTDRSNLSPGLVPRSSFWLVEGNQHIGRLDIRHELNDWLLNFGGHIGYDIRPSRRREGLGMRQLKLGLVEARSLALPRVLLTCDHDNVGSRRIIEGNGGVLENEVLDRATGTTKLRFWIDLD